MLNYPPTFEQLIFPLTASWQLWLVRFLTLSLVFVTLLQVSRWLAERAKVWFWFLVLLSPVSFLLVMSYPISAIKLALVIFVIKKTGRTNLAKTAGLILIALLLLTINIKIIKEIPPIMPRLSFPVLQAELTDRFNKEYLLQPGNYIPLAIKRIAYNKYFFLIKDIGEETLRFAAVETLFFGENHPLSQKSIPVFFWSEFGLFLLALWVWSKNKKNAIDKVGLLLSAAVIYFLTTPGQAYSRHLITFLLLAVIMAEALPRLVSGNKPLRLVTYGLLFLALYGGLAHFVDRLKRPGYWLDNRPLVYQIYFDSIPTEKYDQVFVADLFGYAAEYCRYYKKDCRRFTFANFQMTELSPRENALYIGFNGNFFGVDPIRNFDRLDDLVIDSHRIGFIHSAFIRDNVANGYGQRIIFGVRTDKDETK